MYCLPGSTTHRPIGVPSTTWSTYRVMGVLMLVRIGAFADREAAHSRTATAARSSADESVSRRWPKCSPSDPNRPRRRATRAYQLHCSSQANVERTVPRGRNHPGRKGRSYLDASPRPSYAIDEVPHTWCIPGRDSSRRISLWPRPRGPPEVETGRARERARPE